MGQKQVSDKGLGLVSSALELLLQAIVFVSFTCAIYALMFSSDVSHIYVCFYIIIPVVAGYIIRRGVRKFWMFVFMHIGLIVGMLAVSNGEGEVTVNLIAVVIYTAYSIKLKNAALEAEEISASSRAMMDNEVKKEAALRALAEGEKLPLYLGACMLVGYFIADINQSVIVKELEILLCIAFVVLQIVYGNCNNLYQVFRINKDKNNFPAGQMKRVTAFVTIIVSVFILLGMLLFYNGSFGNINTLVKRVVTEVLKLIARLVLLFIGAFGKEGSDSVTQMSTEEIETEEFSSVATEAVEGSALLEALAEAFGALLIVAGIVGIILVIRAYIKNFNASKKIGIDYIERVKPTDSVEIVEKTVAINRRKVSKEEKNVRKIYKKLVLKGNKGKAPDISHTPGRLTTDNITSDKQLADEITYIYEKARYSNETVSKADIDKMKGL